MGSSLMDRVAIGLLGGEPVASRRVELVERKGLGHPDTLCDALVEAVALALNRLYLERLGTIPHYNVDKALLVAGQCNKGFGWGRVRDPMELVIGDRATFAVNGTILPIAGTVAAAVDGWVAAHLPHVRAGEDLRVRLALAPGSEELRGIYAPGAPVTSNDTCGASGYAPLSPTETLVLDVEGYLNGPDFKRHFPDTGQDVKVFAFREGEDVAITVAMPLLAALTGSEAAYFQRKEAILAELATRFAGEPFAFHWALNALDRPGRGAAGVYLSVTGTSAEDADSGQVGRGNRANGLIAFARPTGGEAAAGKNPVAHAGKIYSVFSHHLARCLHARCPGLDEVYVHLAVRIGDPVDAPRVGVELVLAKGAALGDVEAPVRDVVAAEVARLPGFREELVAGRHAVC
jgi:S-adenosylmethionine synthetase